MEPTAGPSAVWSAILALPPRPTLNWTVWPSPVTASRIISRTSPLIFATRAGRAFAERVIFSRRASLFSGWLGSREKCTVSINGKSPWRNTFERSREKSSPAASSRAASRTVSCPPEDCAVTFSSVTWVSRRSIPSNVRPRWSKNGPSDSSCKSLKLSCPRVRRKFPRKDPTPPGSGIDAVRSSVSPEIVTLDAISKVFSPSSGPI